MPEEYWNIKATLIAWNLIKIFFKTRKRMPITLNQYTLGRTLGSGVSCKVKLAKDSSNARYAVKIIHSNADF